VLSTFKHLVPVPTVLEPENHYNVNIKQVKEDIHSRGRTVILASNPRNPTGQVIRGQDLKELVELSHENSSTIILDELYSWYIYHDDEAHQGRSMSAAEYVEDVNSDYVVIVDGLINNWRLPGLGICWVIGPQNLITALSQSGSFLDDGTNHPFQLVAIPLLDPEHVRHERVALQKHFKMKRDHVLTRLKAIGLEVRIPPVATFYIWLNLENLPDPINNGLTFFEELLKEKTIVIPGIFFDANVAHRRNVFDSPCYHFVRLSFGPPLEELDRGIDTIARILLKARKEALKGLNEGFRSFGHN